MHGTANFPGEILESKRQLILRHARQHFVSEGYAATRMEPIAREAGVSTATLYTLFSGKAALFSAVIDDAAEDFARQRAGVRAIEGDARSALTSFAPGTGRTFSARRHRAPMTSTSTRSSSTSTWRTWLGITSTQSTSRSTTC